MPARVWWTAVGEAILATAIVVAASLVAPGQWGFLQVAPHPLWFAALGIAARYGGSAGYAAGGLIATTLALMIWGRPDDPFGPLPERAFVQPILLFVTTAVLSEVVRGPHRRAARA